jgi:hypothetical protein
VQIDIHANTPSANPTKTQSCSPIKTKPQPANIPWL